MDETFLRDFSKLWSVEEACDEPQWVRFYLLSLPVKSWCAEQREVWLSAALRLSFLPKPGSRDAPQGWGDPAAGPALGGRSWSSQAELLPELGPVRRRL